MIAFKTLKLIFAFCYTSEHKRAMQCRKQEQSQRKADKKSIAHNPTFRTRVQKSAASPRVFPFGVNCLSSQKKPGTHQR